MRTELEAWIKKISDRPRKIKAINIGLFEGEKGYQAYLTGSYDYDPEDDDWACNEDYVPEQKYLELPDSHGLEWEVIQNTVSEYISEIIEESSDTILNHVSVVTVGFDDGDLIRIK